MAPFASRPSLPLRAAFLLALVVVAAPWHVAHAEPWFDLGENAAEDRYLDGEFDEEDHVARRPGGRVPTRDARSDARDESWVGLRGYTRALIGGKTDVGAMVVVGLALDRRVGAPVPRTHPRTAHVPSPSLGPADGDSRGADPSRPGSLGAHAAGAAATPADAPMGPTLARDCVAAALRASGLGVDDERLDSIVARSRASALLPETRLRAMRLWQDASHATTLATADGTTYYDAVGANLVLEVRLTWRLDRLLYAGDEPTIERVRLERFDARTRIATRTLEALFAWTRATMQAQVAVEGSPEEAEGRLRAAEAEATLDVLTGGWFASRGGVRGPA